MKLIKEFRFAPIELFKDDSIKFTVRLWDEKGKDVVNATHVEQSRPGKLNILRIYSAEEFDGLTNAYVIVVGYEGGKNREKGLDHGEKQAA